MCRYRLKSAPITALAGNRTPATQQARILPLNHQCLFESSRKPVIPVGHPIQRLKDGRSPAILCLPYYLENQIGNKYATPPNILLGLEQCFLFIPVESLRKFKSQCRNISRIRNQFRKIEFWFIPPKQPFGMVISENDIKKSPSALHLDSFRKVRKFTKKYNFYS